MDERFVAQLAHGLAQGRAVPRQGPRAAAAWSAQAQLSHAAGHLDAALAAYDRALALRPDHAPDHYGRATVLLTLGRYQEGWREYAWRWRLPGVPAPLTGTPRWDGRPFPGQTLWVYAEQGQGDTLQFVRYLPHVAALGGRVVLACQPALTRLLRPCVPAAVFAATDRAGLGAQPCEAYTHLMDLPGLFHTTPETVPAVLPAVTPAPALVAHWGARLPVAHGPCIGLVWAGNPEHPNDAQRSVPLATLAPLAQVEATWISLQVGEAAAQHAPPGMVLHDVGRQVQDFADTAAVLAHLDLVISVDTAVAHLAGALGTPVWTLLPFAADWRWGLADRTPWYPSMRLFRQPRWRDWRAVVAQVVEALRASGRR
jgi:hypothetical protein